MFPLRAVAFRPCFPALPFTAIGFSIAVPFRFPPGLLLPLRAVATGLVLSPDRSQSGVGGGLPSVGSQIYRRRARSIVDADMRPLGVIPVLRREREVLSVHRLPLLPAETPLVGREQGHVFAGRLHGQLVVGNRR